MTNRELLQHLKTKILLDLDRNKITEQQFTIIFEILESVLLQYISEYEKNLNEITHNSFLVKVMLVDNSEFPNFIYFAILNLLHQNLNYDIEVKSKFIMLYKYNFTSSKKKFMFPYYNINE